MLTGEILLEFDVVNPDMISKWCRIWSRSVNTPTARQWFERTLYRFVLNEPDANRPFEEDDLDVYRDVKNSALSAKIENWPRHDLRVFFPPDRLLADLANVLHWIQAHEQNERFLRQLSRTTVPVAIRKANEWNRGLATEKTRTVGLEVVRHYASGYHWVRYTDPETMRIDGQHLQNCLRHGTYAAYAGDDPIRTIYGLRDSSHRPHAAVAILDNNVIEAKGKQNEPIADKYVDHTVDLLNMIGGLRAVDPSLELAGIVEREKGFGRSDHEYRNVHEGRRSK